MTLKYKLKKKYSSFFVCIEETGKNRRLYLDTLRTIAEESDRKALSLLVKLQLSQHRNPDTVTFENIQIPPKQLKEVIRLMEETGRFVNEIEKVEKKELEAFPILSLKDKSGSFANLWVDYGEEKIEFHDFAPTVSGQSRLVTQEKSFEKDLLEVGFTKKIVENSQYYCPKENVKDAITLLLDVGWKVLNEKGESLSKGIEVSEAGTELNIRSQSRALVDHKLQMEGEWVQETLVIKKTRLGSVLTILEEAEVDWDEKLKKLILGLKDNTSISKTVLSEEFKGKLLPYQQKSVDWLKFLHTWGFSALLADEMGLGKTVQVLAFLSSLRTILPVLIVTPASLTFNWRREIEKFTPALKYRLISYTALRLNIEAFQDELFEVVILDESNAIKQATTQTARSVCKLKANFRICISGTPMENRLDEIWSQFRFLMPDLLERNIELEAVRSRIRPFIMRRKKDELDLDLPEKIEQVSFIEMTEAQKELYETYRKGLHLDGASKMQVLEAILRLRQIALDPRLLGFEIEGAKLRILIDEIEEIRASGHKVLVFSSFTSMLKLVLDRMPDALYLDGSLNVKGREERVLRFQNDPEAQVFLLSLKAGGVGLNLTQADYVYLLDPWWNDAVENQAIDRAHRIGRKGTVIAKRMVVVNSIEEKMLQLKEKKKQTADQLLDLEYSEGDHSHEDLLALLV